MIQFRGGVSQDKPATIFFLDPGNKEGVLSNIPGGEVRKRVEDVLASGRFNAEKGEVFPISWGKKIILLAGIGDDGMTNLTSARTAVRQAINSPHIKTMTEIEIVPASQGERYLAAVVEGIAIGSYAWNKYRTRPAKEIPADQRAYFLATDEKPLFREIETICEGVNFTRDLVNDNADIVTSEYMEQTVRSIIAGQPNISLDVLNEKELKEKGLNLHLAVNQASRKPPKLIIVKYSGAGAKEPFTALIGKGLTFDTGGLDLKPAGHIETMRSDMSGAAAVVGTMRNVIALKLKVNVIFVLGMAENAIGSGSYKPGDVYTSYNGKTVEIANTDAEGRLVLADAISYTVRNYKPGAVIDIATLTGACVTALGYDYSGLVSTDEALIARLSKSGNATDDRVWQLPWYPELKDAVESPVADLKNLGFPKGAGGAITAAEFLRQFTDNTPWAHVDIAGTAFHNRERFYYAAGATGAGVRLLTAYLKMNLA